MVYLGGKTRTVGKIGPIIKELSQDRTSFYDVTLGGGSVPQWMFENASFETFRLSDVSQLAIGATKYVKHHKEEWELYKEGDITKDYYEELRQLWRNSREIDRDHWIDYDTDSLFYRRLGWIGFVLSFGGKCFDGFATDRRGQRFLKQAVGNAKRQHPSLQASSVSLCDYRDVVIDEPHNSVLFADPPYLGTTGYSAGQRKFDHKEFWDVMYRHYQDGVLVFVTERQTIDDRFVGIWSSGEKLSLMGNELGHNRKPYRKWSDTLFIPKGMM